MIDNGFNEKERIKVDDLEAHIIEHYFKEPTKEAIDAHNIINLFPTIKIRDEEVVKQIRRFNYCIMFPNVAPYEGGYNKQPEMFKELCMEIEHCKAVLAKLQREKNGR